MEDTERGAGKFVSRDVHRAQFCFLFFSFLFSVPRSELSYFLERYIFLFIFLKNSENKGTSNYHRLRN